MNWWEGGWVGGWVGGWMGGWMDVKAVSRIAYSNQKMCDFPRKET